MRGAAAAAAAAVRSHRHATGGVQAHHATGVVRSHRHATGVVRSHRHATGGVQAGRAHAVPIFCQAMCQCLGSFHPLACEACLLVNWRLASVRTCPLTCARARQACYQCLGTITCLLQKRLHAMCITSASNTPPCPRAPARCATSAWAPSSACWRCCLGFSWRRA